LLLVACSPIPEEGQPCIEQVDCPAAQFCVRGRCSTSPDGGQPTGRDKDADGVLDDSDNCVDVKNADQVNEDGDAAGDVCDACPLIKDHAAPCDAAHPAQTELWLFESFHADPMWPPVEVGQTPWTVGAGDTLAIAATGTTTAQIRLPAHTGTRRYDDFTVTTQLAVDGRTANAAIGFTVTVDGGSELACQLIDNGSDGVVMGSTISPFAWPASATYQLSLAVHDGRYDCSARTATGAPVTASQTPAPAAYPTNDGALRLQAQGVAARFDWVQILGTPSR
jgi:hypothetical protein